MPSISDRTAFPGEQVLMVEGLSVRYARSAAGPPAVSDLSFRIGRGESFGLVGESGSGKSSAGLAVLKYLPKTARMEVIRLEFEGRDLNAMSLRDLRSIRGSRIAAVYQNPGSALNPSLTIGRQIGEIFIHHRRVSGDEAADASATLLDRMRVQDPAHVLGLYPHELSGGLQQRVAIAMAIALEPALLVLDEPTSALDASLRGEIIGILAELRREVRTSLLLISHDIDLVGQLTDRVGVMQDGRLVEEGLTGPTLSHPKHLCTRTLLSSIPKQGFTKRDGRLGSLAAGADLAGPDPIRRDPAPVHRAASGASGSSNALLCRGISQSFKGRPILTSIDMAIASGETFGLIGESGSGKTTLARILAGLQAPAGGTVEICGAAAAPVVERRNAVQRRQLQMVFQSPDTTLNPRHRVRRILLRSLRRLAGLRGAAASARSRALFEAVRLPAGLLDNLPRELSGGQRQRTAIARAFAGDPTLVILDEATSALDVSVQAAILNLLNDLQSASGVAFLFISHDLKVIRYMADRIGVLYRGHLVESGPADRVFAGPNHPYTAALLKSLHPVGRGAIGAGAASPPGAGQSAAGGCIFYDRCPVAMARCLLDRPPSRRNGTDHLIQCWHELDKL